jgi:DNA-binding NarL/FixJ family response regulator
VIRTLLVDDNASHRELFSTLLGMEVDFDVVGEAADGQEAVDLAARLQPDLVVSDVQMPRLDGLAAVPRLLEVAPQARVVLMSSLPPSDIAPRAAAAGADLYLDKGNGVETTIQELRRVAMSPRTRVRAVR